MAGADSTSIELRACFYYLIKNPAVLMKVLAEIDSADASGNLSSPVKFSESKKLPYLSACIRESIRMFPAVSMGMQRHPPIEGLEIAGKLIPNSCRVSMNPAVVQFDKHIFGNDASEFRPERWLESSEENVKAMDKAMLVFGAGTRTCTGQNVSMGTACLACEFVL